MLHAIGRPKLHVPYLPLGAGCTIVCIVSSRVSYIASLLVHLIEHASSQLNNEADISFALLARISRTELLAKRHNAIVKARSLLLTLHSKTAIAAAKGR